VSLAYETLLKRESYGNRFFKIRKKPKRLESFYFLLWIK